MARRSEHSLEEIREMILKAAETIVAVEGISGLKVRKIATEIGYTVGSIYMVFDSMDDLIMNLKARVLDEIESDMQRVDTDQLNPESAVVELAKAYLHFAGSRFNCWSLVFEHRPPKDQPIPEWYQSRVDHMFVRAERLLARLKPDHTEDEIKRAARALWGGVHGVCMLSLSGAMDIVGIGNVENSVVLLTENFIRGWRCSG